MDFITALLFAKETGKAIVPSGYTKQSKTVYQFYYNGYGELLKQDGAYKPKYASISGEKYKEQWEESPCNYPRYYDVLPELEQELNMLMEELKEVVDELRDIQPLVNKRNILEKGVRELQYKINKMENRY